MFNIFKKTPKYETKNNALYGLSITFHSNEEDPTFKNELLKEEILDYSINSLKHVDEYLGAVRDEELTDEAWFKIVLRAGAYVGEVIRLSDKKHNWYWIEHSIAKEIDPDIWDDENPHVSIISMLYEDKGSYTFPLKKVHKYLMNGTEDSTEYFVKTILK